MEVKIKKLNRNAIIPKYEKEGDAGFDIRSLENTVLGPKERMAIRTGLAFEIPSGYELQLRPRSGLAKKYGISLTNAPATIDSGYRGELIVLLINLGEKPFKVETGDRIAQGIVNKIETIEFREVKRLSRSERGRSGLGHTGKK